MVVGVFGEVFSSFNDFAGHGYHGVSVMRSYLGFDRRPLRAVGSVHTHTLAPHWSMISGERGPREETQENGMVELTLIGPEGEDPRPITVRRETERCDGGALMRVVAYPGRADAGSVEWKNPFAADREGSAPQWHDRE